MSLVSFLGNLYKDALKSSKNIDGENYVKLSDIDLIINMNLERAKSIDAEAESFRNAIKLNHTNLRVFKHVKDGYSKVVGSSILEFRINSDVLKRIPEDAKYYSYIVDYNTIINICEGE